MSRPPKRARSYGPSRSSLPARKDTLATKQDLLLLRQELREEMLHLRGELKAEIHGSASSVTRQVYTALLGQMAVLLGFAYFFATHVAG